jgi:Ser/Thr protein kinase RdoA (MazF antagonist)
VDEVLLPGGRTTPGVVRVGDTIHRPRKPNSPFVHRVLMHLEAKGFKAAPRFLGIDTADREILSFIPGDVPMDLGDFSDAQIAAAARLLRSLHDATADCDLRGSGEVICHGDAGPCNCVFVDGVPTAFIDFDAAHAGARRDDLGYAAWLWLDIGEDIDAELQGLRLADFFAAYGAADIRDAVPAVMDAQARLASRSGPPREWAERCREWTDRNRAGLIAGLRFTWHNVPP